MFPVVGEHLSRFTQDCVANSICASTRKDGGGSASINVSFRFKQLASANLLTEPMECRRHGQFLSLGI